MKTFGKMGVFFSFAVMATGGSDITMECLRPRQFPLHKEWVHQESQKHLSEKQHYCSKWAVEGCSENLNKTFNVVALAETAISSADFRLPKTKAISLD